METNSGFSTNALLTRLRSTLDLIKFKLDCEQIQDLMNLVTDLEYEIHLLQTNYAVISAQSDSLSDLTESVQLLLQKSSTNSHLATINECVHDEDQCSSSCVLEGDGMSKCCLESKTELVDDFGDMAELIANLVVKKIASLESVDEN